MLAITLLIGQSVTIGASRVEVIDCDERKVVLQAAGKVYNIGLGNMAVLEPGVSVVFRKVIGYRNNRAVLAIEAPDRYFIARSNLNAEMRQKLYLRHLEHLDRDRKVSPAPASATEVFDETNEVPQL